MIERYSDVIPYHLRKYWYFTTHGIGPGTIPKDLKILNTIETRGGDYVCLDGVLNTDELSKYDMKESVPPEELIIKHYFNKNGFQEYSSMEVDHDHVLIEVEEDFENVCDYLMKRLDYTFVRKNNHKLEYVKLG